MPVGICLPPKVVDSFKRALVSGKINPEKLAGMTSDVRHKLLSEVVGEGNAKFVNSNFEEKMLLKNQKQGYLNWAKSIAGLKPETRRTLEAKIANMDHVLNPEEERAFLKDLASTKLGFGVSVKEAKKIADLSSKVQEAEALPRSSKEAAFDKNFSPSANDMKYGYARYDFHQYLSELKNGSKKLTFADFKKSPLAVPGHLVRATADISKSIGASLDDSFALRQGAKAFFTNNKAWRKEFIGSFANLAKGFKNSEAANREFNARLMSDPHYDQAIKDGLAIKGNEDAFPTSVPERIPIAGRAFGASEVAYNAFAQNLRLNIYKQQMKLAADLGDKDLPKEYGKNMAKMVNSLTGRGGFGKAEPVSGYFNLAFYSLRFLKSNVDSLLLHPAGIGVGGLGSAAQKKAATNLVKIIAGMAGILATAHALKPGSVDFDPRSSDFGKIKVGHTRFEMTGGLDSLVTLASRLIPTAGPNGTHPYSKSSTSGVLTQENSGTYGAPTIKDAIVNFLSNKTSPVGGVALDLANGKTHNNTKPTVGNEVGSLVEPLNVKNFTELKSDKNSANILASVLADTFGISTNTYGKSQKNDNLAPSKSMLGFKAKVGNQKFQTANTEYNNRVDQFMADNQKKLNSLSNSEKQKAIAGAKSKIQRSVFKQYGYKPSKSKASSGRKSLLQSIK